MFSIRVLIPAEHSEPNDFLFPSKAIVHNEHCYSESSIDKRRLGCDSTKLCYCPFDEVALYSDLLTKIHNIICGFYA